MKPVQPKYSFVTRFRSAGFFVRCHMDGTTSATRTHIMKSRNLCKRRTVNAPHRTCAQVHTYINAYTRASPQLPITTTSAYSPRASTFFLLTATTAHTYDAPAMTNSNTWMGKRTREREREKEREKEWENDWVRSSNWDNREGTSCSTSLPRILCVKGPLHRSRRRSWKFKS